MELTLTNEFGFGNCESYGFANAQRNIKRALEIVGVNIVSNAKKTLCHVGAHLFEPAQGKTNYLWAPHEANKINGGLVEKMNQAYHVIASCEHNKKVFKKAGVTKPISICHLGIDTEIFKPIGRAKSDKFRFLWVGNPIDMRKGWDLAAKAFLDEFTDNDNVELYLKTTGKSFQDLALMGKNVVFDSRNLALADLLDLYESAHAFVYPSRGEATGLPALEAMSMELPVLAPPVTGLKDFIDKESAIPLAYEMVDGEYGIKVRVPQVKIESLRKHMRSLFENYNKFDELRKNARKRVQSGFTIKDMGLRLKEVIYGE